MNRETVIQLVLGSVIFSGLYLFVLPVIEVTPARLVVIYLAASLVALELSKVLAGKAGVGTLVIAGVVVVASALLVTVIP